MRTPGNDKDLVRGFLFNEQIIENIKDIESIESYGEKVGQYNIQNKILVTLNNSKNVNISKIKRDFLTNSSCGVCGKSSLDALEIIKKYKTNSSEPKINKEIIVQSPNILTNSIDSISFYLKLGTQQDPYPCDGPDSPSEGVYFQYYNGSSWVDIHYFNPYNGFDPVLTTWKRYSFPVSSTSANIMYRWFQDQFTSGNSSQGFENKFMYKIKRDA